jgi:hypothetical protein
MWELPWSGSHGPARARVVVALGMGVTSVVGTVVAVPVLSRMGTGVSVAGVPTETDGVGAFSDLTAPHADATVPMMMVKITIRTDGMRSMVAASSFERVVADSRRIVGNTVADYTPLGRRKFLYEVSVTRVNRAVA